MPKKYYGKDGSEASGIDMSPYDLENEADKENELGDGQNRMSPEGWGRRDLLPEEDEFIPEKRIPAFLIPLAVGIGAIFVLMVYMLASGRFDGLFAGGGGREAAAQSAASQAAAAAPSQNTVTVTPSQSAVTAAPSQNAGTVTPSQNAGTPTPPPATPSPLPAAQREGEAQTEGTEGQDTANAAGPEELIGNAQQEAQQTGEEEGAAPTAAPAEQNAAGASEGGAAVLSPGESSGQTQQGSSGNGGDTVLPDEGTVLLTPDEDAGQGGGDAETYTYVADDGTVEVA